MLSSVIRRDVIAIVLASLACGVISALPPFNFIHGWSIDVLTALRWEAFGTRRDPSSKPVAVIAIDEETYDTPPFRGSPTLTWTTEVGRVLDAVLGRREGCGLDIIFPTTIEQSEIPSATIYWECECAASIGPFFDHLHGSFRRQGGARRSPARRTVDPTFWTTDRGRSAENIRALNIYSDPMKWYGKCRSRFD